MSQNSERLSWPEEEVDNRLKWIMKSIHAQCLEAAASVGDPAIMLKGQHCRFQESSRSNAGSGYRIRAIINTVEKRAVSWQPFWLKN
jgi:hypothetical protein